MEIKLASRFDGVQESATVRIAAAAQAEMAAGKEILDFSVGEPHFPIPQPVQDAAVKAIRDGFNKYTLVSGTPELRGRLAQKLKEDNGLDYSPAQIVVSVGAKQAVFNFILSVISPGDEVIIPAPYWTSYPDIVKLAGGTPVIIPTTEAEGFRLTPEKLKRAIGPRTKALILNSPCNPTGVVTSREDLKRLAKVLEGTNVLVCSDEIYEKLVYDAEFTSFAASSQDAFERTITVNGFSKAFSMTGWRLGYAAGPKVVMDAMRVLQGQSTTGANSTVQKAAVAALGLPPENFKPAVALLRGCRDRITETFARSRAVSFVMPQGAFYLFLNIKSALGKKTPQGVVLQNSDDFALYLLKQAGVAAVPGSGFGDDHYIRLSYAKEEKVLVDGAKRILAAMEALT